MFSLVVPIYRNEDSIPALIEVIEGINGSMAGDFEAILVVDGSPDQSLELLREMLPRATFSSQLLALSRNFGSFSAIRAGLEAASGDMFGIMSADLQEPPDLMLSFRERLCSSTCDVVVGIRETRADPLGSRIASALFWWAYRTLVQREMPQGGVDVFGCTRDFRDRLLRLQESNSTLVGLVFWLGFRRQDVRYVRRPRLHGKSAWSFNRRLRYLLDSTFAFSDLPIRILTVVGTAGMVISMALSALVLYAKATGRIPVPGYSATVLTVIFFGAINSLGLGLIGEYLWRTFENTKGRPDFAVATHTRFNTGGMTDGPR